MKIGGKIKSSLDNYYKNLNSIMCHPFYSNCLIEALRAYFKDHKNIKICIKFTNNSFPHFYWLSKSENKYYHFAAIDKDLSIFKQLYFEGYIHIHDK